MRRRFYAADEMLSLNSNIRMYGEAWYMVACRIFNCKLGNKVLHTGEEFLIQESFDGLAELL